MMKLASNFIRWLLDTLLPGRRERESYLRPILHIRVKEDGQTPILVSPRMRVDFIVALYHNPEYTPETICENFSITPGQVYAALSYYEDHKEEIEKMNRETDELNDRLAAEFLASHPEFAAKQQAIIERYKARKKSENANSED